MRYPADYRSIKRLTGCVLALAALWAAVPAPASAGAENCRDSAANVSQCRNLAECKTIGAAIFNYASDGEAVTWTRDCLNLDRRYRMAQSGQRAVAVERARRLRAARSNFRSLYCEAIRRAGRTRPRVCRIRSAGTGGGGGGGGTREPALTG